MASPSQNLTTRLYHGVGTPLPAGLALALYGLAVATFFLVTLTIGVGPLPSTLAQALAFVAVPVIAMRVHGAPARDLGLDRPPALVVVGAVIVALGLWLLALAVAAPILEATGREHAMRAVTERLLPTGTSLAWVLLGNALAPGVCEELLHRGLLLGALAPRLGRVGALLVTTALFALLHLEPARMASAGLLGLVAGVLAMWARSVWPAVVLHVLNNTIALLIGAGSLPWVAARVNADPGGSLLAASAFVIAGIGIAWVGRQQA